MFFDLPKDPSRKKKPRKKAKAKPKPKPRKASPGKRKPSRIVARKGEVSPARPRRIYVGPEVWARILGPWPREPRVKFFTYERKRYEVLVALEAQVTATDSKGVAVEFRPKS